MANWIKHPTEDIWQNLDQAEYIHKYKRVRSDLNAAAAFEWCIHFGDNSFLFDHFDDCEKCYNEIVERIKPKDKAQEACNNLSDAFRLEVLSKTYNLEDGNVTFYIHGEEE